MKTLKSLKSKRFVILVALGVVLSFNAVDIIAGEGFGKRQSRIEKYKKRQERRNSNGNAVGAPLDGGIFSIVLAGAGVAYFTRKRKKNQ